jgi:hypothetical protein
MNSPSFGAFRHPFPTPERGAGQGALVAPRKQRPDEAVVANRLARDARTHEAAEDPRAIGGGAVHLDRQLDVDGPGRPGEAREWHAGRIALERPKEPERVGGRVATGDRADRGEVDGAGGVRLEDGPGLPAPAQRIVDARAHRHRRARPASRHAHVHRRVDQRGGR